MRKIIVIAHDMRSTHNVGSLLRTADGLGIKKVYLTGYTPYPLKTDDQRLPHIAQKQHDAISKTALGAETNVDWEQDEDILKVIDKLRADGYIICALEQAKNAKKMPEFNAPDKCALILGTEVTGIPTEILAICDEILEIPMFGKKESFNVVQAAAMAMYQLRFP